MTELVNKLEELSGKRINQDFLQQAIGKLPYHSRITLQMRYNEKTSFNAICQALDRSISSVRHYHSYGIFLLRQQLKNGTL
mgnify:CR=1 FL=1